VQRPGNYEVTMGFPLKDLLYDMCGGPPAGRTLKACIPGGSSVPILTREETEACLLDYEGVVEKGSMLGSGGVIVFDDSADMVYQIMRLARFYAMSRARNAPSAARARRGRPRSWSGFSRGRARPKTSTYCSTCRKT